MDHPNALSSPLAVAETIFSALLGVPARQIRLDTALRSEEALQEAVLSTLLTPIFDHRYTLLRQASSFGEGGLESKPEYVQVHGYERRASFLETYDEFFAPRLEARAGTMRRLFEVLSERTRPGDVLVETGCLRLAGNWKRDGQSTFLFDEFATATGAYCVSIDITPANVEAARRACSARTSIVLNDSVSYLHQLARYAPGARVPLLYLDSFDLDVENPLPSAIHHLKELTAAWPLLRPGTVVCVDDYNVEPGVMGKGALIDDFMKNIQARVLFEEYQKAWVIGPE